MLKTCKSFLAAQPRRQKLPQQAPQGHSDGSTPQAKATPTGTPRPQQWLLMGVQGCRLPALKPLKPFKPLKPLKSFLAAQPRRQSYPNRHPKATAMARLEPFKSFLAAQPRTQRQKLPQQAPQGHSNGFLWAFKAAVCQPLNP